MFVLPISTLLEGTVKSEINVSLNKFLIYRLIAYCIPKITSIVAVLFTM